MNLNSTLPVPRSSKRKRNQLPWDNDLRYSGVGGNEYFETYNERTINTPILFIHGNGRSSSDWDKHMKYLLRNGYAGDDVWAITFNNRTTKHEKMCSQINHFVENMLTHTQKRELSIVAHSLGVTGGRYWMFKNDMHDVVKSFIGIAGANQGLKSCKYLSQFNLDKGAAKPAQFLRSDYNRISDHPLQKMNNKEPDTVNYYTIRGSKDDIFRYSNSDSPKIDGAQNIELNEDHDGVKDSEITKQKILKWT